MRPPWPWPGSNSAGAARPSAASWNACPRWRRSSSSAGIWIISTAGPWTRLVYRGIAALCQFNDQRVIDGSLDGLSRGTIGSGGGVSRLHASMIQYRLLIVFAVMALVGLYLVL